MDVLQNNKLPKVTVIIPTYNLSRLLGLAVESVLMQTYPNIETIVVGDGSTDDTATMMEQYAGRITYIRQDNQGATAAVKTGPRAASGGDALSACGRWRIKNWSRRSRPCRMRAMRRMAVHPSIASSRCRG